MGKSTIDIYKLLFSIAFCMFTRGYDCYFYGGFHSHGSPFDGWFISWKIRKSNGWGLGGKSSSPSFEIGMCWIPMVMFSWDSGIGFATSWWTAPNSKGSCCCLVLFQFWHASCPHRFLEARSQHLQQPFFKRFTGNAHIQWFQHVSNRFPAHFLTFQPRLCDSLCCFGA